MTDQEINEAVMRKLGWQIHTKTCVFPSVGASIYIGGTHWFKDKYVCKDFTPNYATDIRAAWEIVEWLKERGHRFDLSGFDEEVLDGDWVERSGDYKAIITKDRVACPSCQRVERDNFRACADTAPRAICEAFLGLPDA